MTTLQTRMYYALTNLTAEKAVNAILSWHGEQLLDNRFYDELVSDGTITEDDEPEDVDYADLTYEE